MAKQTIVFEVDTDQITSQNFESLKNKLAEKLLKEAFWDNQNNAWHIKADFDKHVKVKGSISGLEGNPDIIFDKEDFNLDKLTNIEKLKTSVINLKNDF